MGITVCNNTDDFWVVAGFIGDILDTLAWANSLRHTLCCRVDAVGGNFLDRAASRLEIEVGIGLGTDNAVHAEVGHFVVTIGDVHFTQRTSNGAAGRRCEARTKAQYRCDAQKHRYHSFSHKYLLKTVAAQTIFQVCAAVK